MTLPLAVIAGKFLDGGGAVFNAKHPNFGAVGDGVTDETAAIQAALDAAVAAVQGAGGVGTVVLPGGTYLVSSQLVVGAGEFAVQLVGSGRDGTTIKADPSFPANTAVVKLGTTEFLHGARLRDLAIQCSGVTDSIGVTSSWIQELSGLERVLILGYKKYGVEFVGSSANWFIDGAELYGADGAAAAKGIRAQAAGGKNILRNISVLPLGAAAQHAVAIHLVSGGLYVLDGIHIEDHVQGVVFDGASHGSAVGVQGHSNVDDLVTIDNGNRAVVLAAISKGGATNAIVDVGNGVTLTDEMIPWYSQPYDGGLGASSLYHRVNALVGIATDLDFVGGYRQTVDGWYQEDAAASQTAVALTRLATPTDNPNAWIAPRAGSITGVLVHSNDARTAGTLTVEVFKNGAGTGLTAVLDGTNPTFKATTKAKDTDAFVAGDLLDIRITTDGTWAPVTADIRAALEVET